MDSFTPYCKSYNLGHRQLREYFNADITIEEKIDGSQISFGKGRDGELFIRSRGRVFDIYAPDHLFTTAAEVVLRLGDRLTPGWTYRGEYLAKPKHNVLSYARVPKNNIILYDIAYGNNEYFDYDHLKSEATRLGLETVPRFGMLSPSLGGPSTEFLEQFLELESVLGNEKIEGVVFKRRTKPVLNDREQVVVAKYVSPRFKEQHKVTKNGENGTVGKLVDCIVDEYLTSARWEKAVQHLNENGALTSEPRDIGPLVKEICRDFIDEHKEEVKDRLWAETNKAIQRGLVRGFPEWYKERLANEAHSS